MSIKKAACWCLIILTMSIPLAEFGLIVMRIFTKAALSDNAANVIDGITKIIGGGVVSILGMIFGHYMKTKVDQDKDFS